MKRSTIPNECFTSPVGTGRIGHQHYPGLLLEKCKSIGLMLKFFALAGTQYLVVTNMGWLGPTLQHSCYIPQVSKLNRNL
jgi:hypothetical protein